MMGALDSVPKQRFWLLVHFYHKQGKHLVQSVALYCKSFFKNALSVQSAPTIQCKTQFYYKVYFKCKVHSLF